MTSLRKTRVAVVFGGRSTEHAISCVSAGSVSRRSTRTSTRWFRRHHPRGRWVLDLGRPGAARHHRPAAARDHRRNGGAVVLPPTRPARPDGARPGGRAAGARRASTSSSRRCTALRRGRHHPGPAGDGRHPVRGGECLRLGGRDGQGVHQEARRRRGHPRRARTWCCAAGATLSEGQGAARPARLRQAVPGRLLARHQQGHRLGRPGRGSRHARRNRPQGAGRGGDRRAGRSSAGCWRARPAGRRRRRSWPRSG